MLSLFVSLVVEIQRANFVVAGGNVDRVVNLFGGLSAFGRGHVLPNRFRRCVYLCVLRWARLEPVLEDPYTSEEDVVGGVGLLRRR